jgi:dienelactone hydrolase
MITAACLTALASLAPTALPSETVDTTDLFIRRPILAPEQTAREIERFVKRRIPALTPPESADAWNAAREALRQRVLDEVVFRGIPAEWRDFPLNVEWTDTIDTGHGYRIRKLRYEALPGLWVPALLHEPVELADKAPAVLNVNGHDSEGKANRFEQLRCINLAKRGIVSLHPEWLFFGELSGPGFDHSRLAYLDLTGASGLAVFYQAMKRGLDVLVSLPNVDPERVAMTGLSGGGWQTTLLSALDTRIRMVVPNAGHSGLAIRTEYLCDLGDLEQVPQDLVAVADYTHLTALFAPRPALLIFNAKDDCCFSAYRALPSVYEPVLPVYERLGLAHNFAYHINEDPGTHNYDRDNREQLYRFINRHFLPESAWIDEEIPSEGEVKTAEELRVGIPEDNANFFTLAEERAKALPQPSDLPPDARRARLREILRFKPLAVEDAQQEHAADRAGIRMTQHCLRVGEWSVPVAVLENGTSETAGTTLILSDDGKARKGHLAAQQLAAGRRVVAADVLLTGECDQLRDRSNQYAMMIATVGERPLGIQAAQILALADWIRRTGSGGPVYLEADGWNAAVAALCAGALAEQPFERISAQHAPSTLKDLIQKRVDFNKYPALFCFGLLKEFDIDELKSLCPPGTVEISASDPPRS